MNSSAAAAGLRPPKLTMQQSAGARGGKKINTSSGLASPIRNDSRMMFAGSDIDWSSELHQIKNKLLAYETSLSRYVQDVSGKHEIVTEILARYDD